MDAVEERATARQLDVGRDSDRGTRTAGGLSYASRPSRGGRDAAGHLNAWTVRAPYVSAEGMVPRICVSNRGPVSQRARVVDAVRCCLMSDPSTHDRERLITGPKVCVWHWEWRMNGRAWLSVQPNVNSEHSLRCPQCGPRRAGGALNTVTSQHRNAVRRRPRRSRTHAAARDCAGASGTLVEALVARHKTGSALDIAIALAQLVKVVDERVLAAAIRYHSHLARAVLQRARSASVCTGDRTAQGRRTGQPGAQAQSGMQAGPRQRIMNAVCQTCSRNKRQSPHHDRAPAVSRGPEGSVAGGMQGTDAQDALEKGGGGQERRSGVPSGRRRASLSWGLCGGRQQDQTVPRPPLFPTLDDEADPAGARAQAVDVAVAAASGGPAAGGPGEPAGGADERALLDLASQSHVSGSRRPNTAPQAQGYPTAVEEKRMLEAELVSEAVCASLRATDPEAWRAKAEESWRAQAGSVGVSRVKREERLMLEAQELSAAAEEWRLRAEEAWERHLLEGDDETMQEMKDAQRRAKNTRLA
ncbi:hypothetical protein AURDEDRAFT_126014 [Auricularia subglabra TFB-10046 SS5]|nr:hypothetical protein AURDEDRAFT_126014 [Auricularia subglabra TFB-10046 SS5]